jgi:signal transduction histidine kinase
MPAPRRRPLSLQTWLIALFLAIGLIASLILVLVLLPNLESSIRSDSRNAEADSIVKELSDAAQRYDRSAYSESRETDPLQSFVNGLSTQLGGEVRFVSPNRVVSSAYGGHHLLRSPGPEARSAIVTQVPTRRVVIDGSRSIVFAAVPLEVPPLEQGALEAAVPLRGAAGELAGVRRRVLLAVVAVLILSALAGLGLSRALGRRMRRLAGTAAQLASGDLAARAPASRPAELASLGESLNGMAERIEGLVGATVAERDRASGLIASLTEGVISVSPAGDLTVVNRAAEDILHLSPGPGSGRIEALPRRVAQAAGEVLRDPAAAPLTREVELPGGRVTVIHVATLPDRAQGVVLTVRDVTDERRLERARRDLVANVSHELKTPLAALRGFIELLEDPRLDEARRREFVELMGGEAQRLQRLVEEQLELARLDAGGLRLEREVVDLGELAASVTVSRQALAEREGIVLAVAEAREAGPSVLSADPARIEQVLLILLDNALRHTPAGGRVDVLVGRDGASATLTVRDTGEGIPPELHPFVFDRFYRADASREGRGAGLGLAIARGLVSAHGGAIDLRSQPGRGSTFTVRLPFPAPEPPITAQGQRPAIPAAAPR